MERIAEACKDVDLKIKLLREDSLLSPFPMLRPGGLIGLLQVCCLVNICCLDTAVLYDTKVV